MRRRAALLSILVLALGCKGDGEQAPAPQPSASNQAAQRVVIKAVTGAFEPAEVHLKQGVPAILEFTRVVDSDCVNAVRMPWMKEPVDLPMNKKVDIPVDTSKAGTFTYSCWMSMVFGRVVIDPR